MYDNQRTLQGRNCDRSIGRTKKNFLAFRVPPDLKSEIQEIANREARSLSQVCELLLSEGVCRPTKRGTEVLSALGRQAEGQGQGLDSPIVE